MKHIGSMQSFLAVIFAIILYLCHRKIICAALMALDEILQVSRTDAVTQLCTTLEKDILTLPPLLSITEK